MPHVSTTRGEFAEFFEVEGSVMRDKRVHRALRGLMPGKTETIVRSLPEAPGRWPAMMIIVVTMAAALGLVPLCGDGNLVCGQASVVVAGRQAEVAPEQARLEALVRKLASPAMEGRRGEGGRKAAAFLIEEFRRLNLEPLFAGQFVQEIPAADASRMQGRNVGAILRGGDAKHRDEWVIVAAHYDHLGVRGGMLYPGADDNASGVAMMLEVARSLSAAREPPRRSVMFIGFDLEEIGLFGSRYFVAHPPVPLKQIALFITADMIGRSLGGVCENYVFVLGTEHAPGLRSWIDEARRDRPLRLGLLGSDVLVLNRSDYGPFRSRQVPYLFFSTGENPCYHSTEDKPETLNYPKLAAISQVIHQIAATAASAPEVPRWTEDPDHPLAEAITIRDVIRKLLENRKVLELGGASTYFMSSTLRNVEEIIARGMITPAERAGMVQAARLVLLMIH
jgi:hypothetical protein